MLRVRATAIVAAFAVLGVGCAASVPVESLGSAPTPAVTVEVAVQEPTSLPDQVDVATPVPDPTVAAPTAEVRTGLVSSRVRVVDTFGHDRDAFSQGLVFVGDRLYESRGRYGESALTEIDPQTGEVLRRVDLADEFFAEGLAFVDGRLIQLTWQEEVAFVWDAETFEPLGDFTYQGEGWGLCYDGQDLWMSDGSDTLTRRDASDFTPLELVNVTLSDQPLIRLNELECIDGLIWANVWQTDFIVVIEPATGEVVETIDAAGLLSPEQLNDEVDVLNGIAYNAVTGSVVVTGKLWPSMFEIERDPA